MPTYAGTKVWTTIQIFLFRFEGGTGSSFGFSISATCGTLAAECIVRLPFEDDSVVEDVAAALVSSLGPARALLL